MRARPWAAVASLVAVLAAASAAAGDDPAVRLDDLAKRLVAPDPAVRERAERTVAGAPPEDLRALVRLLRDRMLTASPDAERDPFVEAEIPKTTVKDGDATRGLYYRVRLLALEPELAAKWLGAPSGAAGGVVVPVPVANVERLGGPQAERSVGSSEMAAYDGQTVFVQVVDRIAYLADYEVEAVGTGRIADPIVRHASEGVHLELRGRRTKTGIHVEVDARGGHVEKPIPVVELALGGTTTPVKVQVPTTTAFRARTAMDVADGGSFLVGDLGPASTTGGRLVTLVTVHAADFTKPGVVPNSD